MTSECKWMKDEICVNADCPMCADFCPVADNPGVCRYEEREDVTTMAERCVCCGDIIPEGRQVCPACEKRRGDNAAD
jgi:hypothetical protein